MRPRFFAFFASFALLAMFLPLSFAAAQTSYPMVMSLHPVAAQTGAISEHTINSRYSMYGADHVIISGTGVTGEIVHPEKKEADKKSLPNLQTMKVRITVAADAAPGVRDFRITTPRGVSTLGQLVIVVDPVAVEAKANNTADDAEPVSMPATICGRIEKAEDVDVFRFSAATGQKLSFHVRSMRLQNRIHDLQKHSDPILTLRNASGVTLAQSDNVFFGDPFIAHEFVGDGEYLLEIRDVRYQGNAYWEYSIEVSDRPFLTNLYPLAMSPGSTVPVEPVGFHLPQDSAAQVTTSADLGEARVTVSYGDAVSTPAPIVVTDLPIFSELNEENGTPQSAVAIAVPAAINGRIEKESDVDCFVFEAKKGELFSIDVKARRHGSAIDSHLRILDANGKQLQVADDLKIGKRNSTDSWIENWTAPADGKYTIEVRDLHLRGGAAFIYYIEVTRAQPYFELYVDTDKTQLSPGTSGVIFVRVVRKNGFVGAVDLSVDGLPAGVTAAPGRILGGKGVDGCLVLTADETAPAGAANMHVTGTAVHVAAGEEAAGEEAAGKEAAGEEVVLTATALPYQETYMPGGGRGHYPVQFHTVSVSAPNDIRGVHLSEYDVVLKPGESKKVVVTLDRAPGFDKNVSLDVIYKHLSSVYGNSLPEGVTMDATASKILLTKGASEGHIVLKAAAGAPPVSQQQVAVMANVSLNFVMKATYASQPLRITVEKAE